MINPYIQLDAKFAFFRNMSLREIAEKLGLKYHTVKSWHYRQQWAYAKRQHAAMLYIKTRHLDIGISNQEVRAVAERCSLPVRQRKQKIKKPREKLLLLCEILRYADKSFSL